MQLVFAAIGLPFFFLAGFARPAEAIPQVIRTVALLLPSTLAIEALVNVAQLGAALSDARNELLGLWLLAALYGGIAVLFEFRGRGNLSCRNLCRRLRLTPSPERQAQTPIESGACGRAQASARRRFEPFIPMSHAVTSRTSRPRLRTVRRVRIWKRRTMYTTGQSIHPVQSIFGAGFIPELHADDEHLNLPAIEREKQFSDFSEVAAHAEPLARTETTTDR